MLHQSNKHLSCPVKVYKSCCVCLLYCFLPQGAQWTPSKMIHRLGKEIGNPDSVCYWAYKVNNRGANVTLVTLRAWCMFNEKEILKEVL